MQLANNVPLDLANYFSLLGQIYFEDICQILGCKSIEQTFNYKFLG